MLGLKAPPMVAIELKSSGFGAAIGAIRLWSTGAICGVGDLFFLSPLPRPPMFGTRGLVANFHRETVILESGRKSQFGSPCSTLVLVAALPGSTSSAT